MQELDDHRFTLVELIVTLTVLLVLVGILSVPLAYARRRSHEAACASNLGQLGIAILHYADDWGSYPRHDPLKAAIDMPEVECPANRLSDFDPYSVGYYGGHPRTTQANDFLIVCGCHNRGTLALFGDFHVGNTVAEVNQPVLMTVGGQAVTPGYVFSNNGNLLLAAPNGQTASITGVRDAQLISAYYDPSSWDGAGEFIVLMAARTPQTNHPRTAVDQFRVKGDSYVNFAMRLQYTIVSLRKEPGSSSSLKWKSKGASQVNDIAIHKTIDHKVKHRYNVSTVDGEGPTRFTYDISPHGITATSSH